MKTCLLLAVFSMVLISAVRPTSRVVTREPRGCRLEIGDTSAGGIIFHLDSGKVCHGLVCALSNLPGNIEWNKAVTSCNALNIAGYADWRLPTSDELDEMYWNLYLNKLADFPVNYYWSSTVDNNGLAYAQYFSGGSRNVHRYVYKNYSFYVRAVRAFKYLASELS